MLNKEHNKYEGLQEIVNIRSSLNLGLSNEIKKAFPSTVPAIRPEILRTKISGASWLAGFAITPKGVRNLTFLLPFKILNLRMV